MGLSDAFGREDRVEITVSQLISILQNCATVTLMENAIQNDVPHEYIRAMVTGSPLKTQTNEVE